MAKHYKNVIKNTRPTSIVDDSRLARYKFFPIQSKAMAYGDPTMPVSNSSKKLVLSPPPMLVVYRVAFRSSSFSNSVQ